MEYKSIIKEIDVCKKEIARLEKELKKADNNEELHEIKRQLRGYYRGLNKFAIELYQCTLTKIIIDGITI